MPRCAGGEGHAHGYRKDEGRHEKLMPASNMPFTYSGACSLVIPLKVQAKVRIRMADHGLESVRQALHALSEIEHHGANNTDDWIKAREEPSESQGSITVGEGV